MADSGKVALITGATGQRGAYVSELLLLKGYSVHGMKRRSSSFNTGVELLQGDPSKARDKLGWVHEASIADLCSEMVKADFELMQLERRSGAG